MKKLDLLGLIFTILLTVSAFTDVSAQDQEFEEQPSPRRARPFRMIQELGLTREQIQQIRRINQERRPVMQDAQRRWRAANRDLDSAVYADDANEARIKELVKEAQLAQAELLKERTLTEYLIRGVLTPEQLVKFRGLRQQLKQDRFEDRKNRRDQNIQNQPQKQFNRFEQRRIQNRAQ